MYCNHQLCECRIQVSIEWLIFIRRIVNQYVELANPRTEDQTKQQCAWVQLFWLWNQLHFWFSLHIHTAMEDRAPCTIHRNRIISNRRDSWFSAVFNFQQLLLIYKNDLSIIFLIRNYLESQFIVGGPIRDTSYLNPFNNKQNTNYYIWNNKKSSVYRMECYEIISLLLCIN